MTTNPSDDGSARAWTPVCTWTMDQLVQFTSEAFAYQNLVSLAEIVPGEPAVKVELYDGEGMITFQVRIETVERP